MNEKKPYRPPMLRTLEVSTGVRELRQCPKCAAQVIHRQMRHHDDAGAISYYWMPVGHQRADGTRCNGAEGRTT